MWVSNDWWIVSSEYRSRRSGWISTSRGIFQLQKQMQRSGSSGLAQLLSKMPLQGGLTFQASWRRKQQYWLVFQRACSMTKRKCFCQHQAWLNHPSLRRKDCYHRHRLVSLVLMVSRKVQQHCTDWIEVSYRLNLPSTCCLYCISAHDFWNSPSAREIERKDGAGYSLLACLHLSVSMHIVDLIGSSMKISDGS